jgi:hypothetical protein
LESTASFLGEVQPIFTLDVGGDDQDSGFTLNQDGQIVR